MCSQRLPNKSRISITIRLALLGGGVLLLLLGILYSRRASDLPGRFVSSSHEIVDIQRCAQCHDQECENFLEAPHMHTLTPANDPEIMARFAGHTGRSEAEGSDHEFFKRDGQLWVQSSAYPDPMRIDWIFGSGSHAQTPISLWQDPQGRSVMLEHRISWYPGDVFAETLGFKGNQKSSPGFHVMGKLNTHAETMQCLGCHATRLPHRRGRVDSSKIVTGLRCERCHEGGGQHASEQEGDSATGPVVMESWSDLTPLESINRCGNCHRRADHFTADELTPQNKLLLRFAPVGMSLSACFQGQDSLSAEAGKSRRFDCTTCHDPHRAASKDPQHYVRQCLICHGSQPGDAPDCASQAMTSQCLSCHMPAVEVQKNLSFTDHWIRIRDDRPASDQKNTR